MATISNHHVRAALHGLIKKGSNPEEALLKAGITPQVLKQNKARVSDWQMTRLVQHVWQELSDEFMGFTQHPCPAGSFAFMLNTVSRCQNLKQVLITGMQFYNLVNQDIHTRLICDKTTATIEITFKDYDNDPEQFFLEFWLVIWHRVASWICGIQIPLTATHFNFDKPKRAQELQVMFPSTHAFAQSANRLCFAIEHLDAKPIRTDKEIRQFLKLSPYDLLTIPGVDLSLKRQVQEFISQHLTDNFALPSLAFTAKHLNLSQPTLHRKLQNEGTSFQQIKDDTRRDMAINLLLKEQQSVLQISELLGFSDARSLTRAFKKWTGLSPRDYCRFAK